MRKVTLKWLAIAVGFCAFTSPGYSYIVDGLLTDWGVTPFTDWVPSSPTTEWASENNVGGPGNNYSLGSFGGEQYDVEAAYFDDTPDAIYFAIVTSFPQSGVMFGSELIEAGDFAFDLYAGGGYGYEYGIKVTGSDFGKLYYNPTWTLPDGNIGYPENAPSTFTGGTYLGDASLVYYNTGIIENGYSTYVIEGSVSKSLLGNPEWGQQAKMHWTMTCGNDDININGTVSNPVPEPATLLLLGSGLMGLVGLKRRKSKLQNA